MRVDSLLFALPLFLFVLFLLVVFNYQLKERDEQVVVGTEFHCRSVDDGGTAEKGKENLCHLSTADVTCNSSSFPSLIRLCVFVCVCKKE